MQIEIDEIELCFHILHVSIGVIYEMGFLNILECIPKCIDLNSSCTTHYRVNIEDDR
jgi:hypothetical protein